MRYSRLRLLQIRYKLNARKVSIESARNQYGLKASRQSDQERICTPQLSIYEHHRKNIQAVTRGFGITYKSSRPLLGEAQVLENV